MKRTCKIKLRTGLFAVVVSLVALLCACAPGEHEHTAASFTVTQAPTCTTSGEATGTCILCGEDMLITLEQIPHTYAVAVVAPTCETAGYTRHTCACGDTYDDAHVPAKGHDWASTVISPVCEKQGYTHSACACGYTRDDQYVPPKGHTFAKAVTQPTCEEGGYTTYTCECGYTYDSDATAPTGHTFTETVIAPTCEEGGYTIYTCECGFTYDSDMVPPTGHTLIETVTPPTCGAEGFTHYACAICDYERVGNPVAPLAHANMQREVVYATVSHPGYTRHVCGDCGYSYEDGHVLYEDVVSGAYVENVESLAQGIDTSKWNHEVNAAGELRSLDFEALKAAGVQFVILKAGSTNGIDPAFEQDYLAAKAAGLEVGAYFYAYSTTVEDTLRDAELLLSWLEGKQFEYPIYFDAEDSVFDGMGKEALTELCVMFLERLQEAGYYAALYTNNEWLYNRLDTTLIKSSFDVWYARYVADALDGSSAYTLEDTDFPWRDGTGSISGEADRRYGLWQYTSCGYVEGFSLPFDFNYAFKDYGSIMKLWGLNGF